MDGVAGSGIAGAWVHAHEDDHDDVLVFRPADVELPPSRGRTSFELRPDGTAVSGTPGPDDRGAVAAGDWSLSDDVLTVRTPTATFRYHVVSAAPECLELRRLPA